MTTAGLVGTWLLSSGWVSFDEVFSLTNAINRELKMPLLRLVKYPFVFGDSAQYIALMVGLLPGSTLATLAWAWFKRRAAASKQPVPIAFGLLAIVAFTACVGILALWIGSLVVSMRWEAERQQQISAKANQTTAQAAHPGGKNKRKHTH